MPLNKQAAPDVKRKFELAFGPATCEVCGAQVEPVDIHSFVVVYALPGRDRSDTQFTRSLPVYQCDHEQHIGCSYEHAALAAITCMLHHMNDNRHEGATDINDVNLQMVHLAMQKFA